MLSLAYLFDSYWSRSNRFGNRLLMKNLGPKDGSFAVGDKMVKQGKKLGRSNKRNLKAANVLIRQGNKIQSKVLGFDLVGPGLKIVK